MDTRTHKKQSAHLNLPLKRLAVAILLGLSAQSGISIAQETSSVVRGSVIDRSGNPVPNATVTVLNDERQIFQNDADRRLRNIPGAQSANWLRLQHFRQKRPLLLEPSFLRSAGGRVIDVQLQHRTPVYRDCYLAQSLVRELPDHRLTLRPG